jgi:hypothetical protein
MYLVNGSNVHVVDQDEHVVDQDVHVVDQDVHVVDQDVAVVDQDVHVVDQDVHVVDQDVHVFDQDVAVDDGAAIHDVRCDSSFCVSMIVNDRNGLGAIVLDVHQDGGEVRANIDGIDVCHLIGGGSVQFKNRPKEGEESTFLKVILAVWV